MTDKQAIKAKDATREDRRFMEEHKEGLAKSTLRARWVHSPDEHEDHPGETLATRSHEVIKHWADERDAKPVAATMDKNGEPRTLRFDFAGQGSDNLQHVDWEEWFKPFDERELVFLFQEHKSDGHQSNFFRLDNPERERA